MKTQLPAMNGRAAAVVLVLAAALLSGCGTMLPEAHPQPEVRALAPATSGVLADLEARVKERFGDDSGFYLVSPNESGMRWRLAMIQHATTSLDAMYFIWQDDPAGSLLFDRVLEAADRGVRVRLMVDDLTLATKDRELAALCLHPQIDIKLYNPIKVRGGAIGYSWSFLTRMKRSNRRMHNKLMVADNRLAMVGGRNLGDDYFGIAKKFNFRDLDALAAGDVVEELSEAFDEFWNAKTAYPGTALTDKATPHDLEKVRRATRHVVEKHPGLLAAFQDSPKQLGDELAALPGLMVFGKALVLQDEPVLIGGDQVRLMDLLDHLAEEHRDEILISSPYLIPVGSFLDDIKEAVDGGATVKILTGSMGANNHTSAHAHYAKYRRRILATGAELYEFDPQPNPEIRKLADTPPARASFIGLHMKAIVADRSRCYVGSLNLDPRSIDLNTENGLWIESPELGEQLATEIEQMMSPENAWRVHLDPYDRLYWTSSRGTVHRQPARGFGQRIAAFFFRLLPIEGQL